MIYLDNAATTKVDEEVLRNIMHIQNKLYGNPSSSHRFGRKAFDILSKSRNIIARNINSQNNEVFFTSCGSESNNFVVLGIARHYNYNLHIITSKIEHASILNTCKYLENKGVDVTYLSVNSLGYISPQELERSITENTKLISISLANNEIGTIQQLTSLTRLSKNNNIVFHTDAVQAVGHLKVDVNELGVDALSASAHKFNGPKGTAFAYIREGIGLEKLLHGGKQEFSMRAGTENVADIYGMALALDDNIKDLEQNTAYVKSLINMTLSNIKKLNMKIKTNGDLRNGLPGLLSLVIPKIESEVTKMFMDSLGIYIATGSACSNLDAGVSHVLLSIGLPLSDIKSTIRVSYGKYNTMKDVTIFTKALFDLMSIRNDITPNDEPKQ